MELLAKRVIRHGNTERTIELFHGDLANLPRDHSVDLLIISAVRNGYSPTVTSLIGSLYDVGISVTDLAADKQLDLREQFSCWLSHPLPEQYAFRQILCIESGWRGSPPEITDDLFRALVPCLLTDLPDASVAMSLIGAGDQGHSPLQMMESILNAAVSWLNRGLQLKRLKIVVRSEQIANSVAKVFSEFQPPTISPLATPSHAPQHRQAHFDLFMSYSHKDSQVAHTIVREVQRLCPHAQIFYDREALLPGQSWLMHIAESLDSSKRVAALFTPDYWRSTFCKDEFAAALARQNDTGNAVLFPIYFLSAPIPYLFRNLQFHDCREANEHRLSKACHALAECLS
jgi:hypothetical protein